MRIANPPAASASASSRRRHLLDGPLPRLKGDLRTAAAAATLTRLIGYLPDLGYRLIDQSIDSGRLKAGAGCGSHHVGLFASLNPSGAPSLHMVA